MLQLLRRLVTRNPDRRDDRPRERNRRSRQTVVDPGVVALYAATFGTPGTFGHFT